MPGKVEVLIPSVMALRETAMTAPLGQQGEPLAANGRPYKKNGEFSEWPMSFKNQQNKQCRTQPGSALLSLYTSF